MCTLQMCSLKNVWLLSVYGLRMIPLNRCVSCLAICVTVLRTCFSLSLYSIGKQRLFLTVTYLTIPFNIINIGHLLPYWVNTLTNLRLLCLISKGKRKHLFIRTSSWNAHILTENIPYCRNSAAKSYKHTAFIFSSLSKAYQIKSLLYDSRIRPKLDNIK